MGNTSVKPSKLLILKKDLPFYTAEQFKKLSEELVLLIVDGYIINATDYVSEHPGGKRLLEQNAGKDCTEIFYKIHRINKKTIKIFNSLILGKLNKE
jgi:cytochrome b involved in lipid metabolism